jgi:hypothetical protein
MASTAKKKASISPERLARRDIIALFFSKGFPNFILGYGHCPFLSLTPGPVALARVDG